MNEPKFIQIAAYAKTYAGYIIALDENGQVWSYDMYNENRSRKWEKVPSERINS